MIERLGTLLESLRRGEQLELELEQIEALITWLGGSSRRASAQQVTPDHDPVLVLLVLQQLDRSLFKDYRLNPEAAGLGPEQPTSLRRMRFRRLAGVFHPDRFPDLADWLTVRSQAVHHAYARFKQDPDARLDYDRPERPTATPETRNPATTTPIRRPKTRNESNIHDWLMRLRARFGRDRWLAQKLIAVLALMAALPVANLYLARGTLPPQPETVTIPDANPVGPVAGLHAIASGVQTNDEQPAAAEIKLQAEDIAHPTEQNRAEKSAAELAQILNDRRPPLEQRTFGPTVEEQLAALGLNSDGSRLDRLHLDRLHLDRLHLDRLHLDPPQLDRPAAGSETAAQTNRSAPPARSEPLNAQTASEFSTNPLYDQITPAEEVENNTDGRSTIETSRRQTASIGAPMSNNVALSGPTEPVTIESNADSPAARALIRLDTAADTSTINAQNQAAQKGHATPETPEQGLLVLGPLKSHAVGHLLAGYQSHVESGSLSALMALFSSEWPNQGRQQGSESVADYYRTLFRRSSHRTIDLRVLRVQREGDGWWVETELNFNITANRSREQITNGRVQFHIQPDRGALKIAAIEY